MNKNKLHKGIRTGIIILAGLIVIAVLAHLTINYLIPFIAHLHSNAGAY